MSQKAPKKRIRNREQVRAALELRKGGATYQAIGDHLGVGASRAWKIVQEGLQDLEETTKGAAEELRRLELERLDALQLSLWKQRTSPRVVDTLLRISERRAKLLGLDAPTLLAPTTPEGKALPQAPDFRRLTTPELEELERLYAKATAPVTEKEAPAEAAPEA